MGEACGDGCIVRLQTADGLPAGIGALVTERHIITCAHVVNAALSRSPAAQDRPTGTLTVDFPLLPGSPAVQATIALWVPPPREGAAGADIAGLELTAQAPQGAHPVRLAVDPPRPGTNVRVFGCPADRPDGTVVEATVQGGDIKRAAPARLAVGAPDRAGLQREPCVRRAHRAGRRPDRACPSPGRRAGQLRDRRGTPAPGLAAGSSRSPERQPGTDDPARPRPPLRPHRSRGPGPGNQT